MKFFFLPLQTKGKKVLIAFCMAIKKLLEESQPEEKMEKKGAFEIHLIFDEFAKSYIVAASPGLSSSCALSR